MAKAAVPKSKPVRVSGDPEFFVAKTAKGKVTNRKKIVPICGLLGGTKDAPIPIPGFSKKDGYMMQEDGVAVEFNFPPSSDGPNFAYTVEQAVRCLEIHLNSLGLSMIHKKCAYTFPGDVLASYPQALIIGCSPDVDAYARRPREGISLDKMGNERFTAGHFHISFPNPNSVPNYVFARFLDAFLALPYVPLDKQGHRRQFYGLAGLYRDTEYPDGSSGLEYRTMSNFWVTEPVHASRMSDTIIRLIRGINSKIDMAAKIFDSAPWADIKNAIDTENDKEAQKLYDLMVNYSRDMMQPIIPFGGK